MQQLIGRAPTREQQLAHGLHVHAKLDVLAVARLVRALVAAAGREDRVHAAQEVLEVREGAVDGVTDERHDVREALQARQAKQTRDLVVQRHAVAHQRDELVDAHAVELAHLVEELDVVLGVAAAAGPGRAHQDRLLQPRAVNNKRAARLPAAEVR